MRLSSEPFESGLQKTGLLTPSFPLGLPERRPGWPSRATMVDQPNQRNLVQRAAITDRAKSMLAPHPLTEF